MKVDFGYAQARAQARLGDRLSPGNWRTAEASDDIARYVHTLRGTRLAPLVDRVTTSTSPHAIDLDIREAWRDEVDAASRWVPEPWRPAVRWTRWLPDLAAIGFIAAGGSTYPWMREDGSIGGFVADGIEGQNPFPDSPFERLGPDDANDMLDWWYRQWRAQWPPDEAGDRGLSALVRLLGKYRTARITVRPDYRRAGEEARDRLEHDLVRMLHTRLFEPVIVFAHLALTGLELRRLRAGLVRRALHNDRVQGAAA